MIDPAAGRVRRLPVVPIPLPRESLLSWLTHLAAEYDVPRNQIAEACGIVRTGKALRVTDSGPGSVMHGFGDADLIRMEQATGLSRDKTQAMTWQRFTGTVINPQLANDARGNRFRVMKANWVDPRELRFCPACIEETGGRWPLEWSTPWTFACQRHNCYLLAECPACRTPLRAGTVNFRKGTCQGKQRHRLTDAIKRCEAEYRNWQAPTLRDEVLVELQHLLEKHLISAQPDTRYIQGDFADLIAMANFALWVAQPEHLNSADPAVAEAFAEFCAAAMTGTGRSLYREPKPMARTAALRVASEIVFSSDPWSSAREIIDFASRPLPVQALPLHQAWRKRPPQGTTGRLERIVRSMRIAAPAVRTLDGLIIT
ncbi:TniQ family protein [Streptomyces anulatus]|uniref:TniQ family protein n=1 Tax=Streptomyces anulatus TaxID=1892 RepID=UPI0038691E23|nr:TniQ family protein [Streptomyces anulatus]